MRRLPAALAALALMLFALVGIAAPAVAATPTSSHVATELRVTAPAIALPLAPKGPKGPGQQDASTFEFSVNGAKGKPSTPLTIILAMTVLSVAPALLLMCTCFTKILVVLGLTRNALGLTTVPPNQVLAGLALFLSLFVMAPVLTEMNEVGVQPFLKGDKGQSQAFTDGVAPLREFMIGKTRTDELRMITGVAGYEKPKNPQSVPLATLIPAFVLSELKSAFHHRVHRLRAVPDHRPHRQRGVDVDGHDDASTRDDLAAVQAAALRDGRRLGPHHHVPAEDLLGRMTQ